MYDFNDAAPQIIPGAQQPAWLTPIDFQDINERLQRNLGWVKHFFPSGVLSRDRKYWCMADWSGREPTNQGSCRIDMTGDKAGYGHDFTTHESEDPIGAIRRASGLSGRALIEELQRWAGMGAVLQMPAPRLAQKGKGSLRDEILAASMPLKGTLGETYLNARKLAVPASSDLMFHADLTEGNRGYCGLVVLVRDGKGQPTGGIQRTYLSDDGMSRALGADGKKLERKSLGPVRGGSVRLAAIAEDGHLGIAEGVETALSATAIFGVPCWAALGTGGLLSWEMPAEVKRVTVFADARDAGQLAAKTLVHTLQLRGVPVEMRSPLYNDDFNDDLQRGVRAQDYPAIVRSPAVAPIPMEACQSEDAVALEFVKHHQDRLRYVNQWRGWMVWDGKVWNSEKTLAAYDMVRSFCRNASLVVSEDKKLSTQLRKASTIASVESLSRSDRRMAMTIEAWDADDWLLGTPSGIIDLRTGENIGVRPDKYITRITTVSPDAHVGIGTWLKFLRRVTRDNQAYRVFPDRLDAGALLAIYLWPRPQRQGHIFECADWHHGRAA